jgi:pimeloyl-ACP methyl ester carboxylesterase
VKDVGSAIDFILRRRNIAKLNLMGWSWGTVIMGAYSADRNDKVDSLVLVAPGWLQSPPQTASQPLGAYVATVPTRARLQAGAPEERKNDLMPGFDAWSAAAVATDPVGSKQDPPVMRSPAGGFLDQRNYWQAGKPFYNPNRIGVPALVVVAEWDGLNPPEGAQEVFRRLPSGPDKRLVMIGEGTHLVMMEKNRLQLFREVQLFLDRARLTN